MFTFGRHLVGISTRKAEKPELDGEVVAKLSAFPEDRVLDYFWHMHREGANTLELLLQLGAVVIQRPSDWSPADVRREHEAGRMPVRIDKRQCFGCGAFQCRLYYHHVLEVYHGGSNTPRNLVPLCHPCHEYLHPWLGEEPSEIAHARGFERADDIMPRVMERLIK